MKSRLYGERHQLITQYHLGKSSHICHHRFAASRAAAPLFDCVLIRYDSNADGALSGTNEIVGYRYNGTSQAIEFKSWSTAATQQSERCADTGTTWEAITNNGFTEVTTLSFEITPSTGASTQGQRQVTITIVGRSKQNQALDMQLQREVRLRNDEY